VTPLPLMQSARTAQHHLSLFDILPLKVSPTHSKRPRLRWGSRRSCLTRLELAVVVRHVLWAVTQRDPVVLFNASVLAFSK
jgi:hypothetical protein